MNERQAVKFWNAIASGEIIGQIPDTEHVQGCPIEKPTYTSAICDQFDMPILSTPRIGYSYNGEPTGTVNPIKEHTEQVAQFLRMLADKIESSATVKL